MFVFVFVFVLVYLILISPKFSLSYNWYPKKHVLSLANIIVFVLVLSHPNIFQVSLLITIGTKE